MKLKLIRDGVVVHEVDFTPDVRATQMANHAEDFVLVTSAESAFPSFHVKHGDRLELESSEYAQLEPTVQTTPEQPVDS